MLLAIYFCDCCPQITQELKIIALVIGIVGEAVDFCKGTDKDLEKDLLPIALVMLQH
jgi:hypothetical protein